MDGGAPARPPFRVAVIGGGVIGLSSALTLARSLAAPFTVRVIAEKWSPNTTSDGAGALWEARSDFHARWAKETLAHYHEMLSSDAEAAARAGVALIRGTQWHCTVHEEMEVTSSLPECAAERVGREEVERAAREQGRPFVEGWRYTSVIVNSPAYLAWLRRELEAACAARAGVGGGVDGGPSSASPHPHSHSHSHSHPQPLAFETRKVDDLRALAGSGEYDLVVNATGLGARELASDPAVHAVRGQTIRVLAPHIREWATAETPSTGDTDELTYVLPRLSSGVVVCGGTYVSGDEDLSCREDVARALWARCTRLVPALLDAPDPFSAPRAEEGTMLPSSSTAAAEQGGPPAIEHWTGLRPGRAGDVRLELEEVPVVEVEVVGARGVEGQGRGAVTALSPAAIIHNYGHGGCGHSLHWGCAMDVARMGLGAQAKRRV
jgi:glycine/D-amino acid oxidase-like deaminating enzyme